MTEPQIIHSDGPPQRPTERPASNFHSSGHDPHHGSASAEAPHLDPTERASPGTHSESPAGSPTDEQLARIFNTAIIASRSQKDRNFYRELSSEMKGPVFRSILSAIRELSQSEEISPRQAAEEMIAQFRRIDSLWREYVFHEGVEQMRARATAAERPPPAGGWRAP